MGGCVSKDKTNEKSADGPVRPAKSSTTGARRLSVAGDKHDGKAARDVAANLPEDRDDPPSPTSSARLRSGSIRRDSSRRDSAAENGIPPGSVKISFGTCSIAGYEPMNPFKQNQDIFVVVENFGADSNQTFIGVFDGHGFAGKDASHYVKDKLPATIDKDRHALKSSPEKAMAAAFMKTNKALRSSKVDVTYSGTTAVTALVQGRRLMLGNTGDSRAVLGVQEGETIKAYDLTDDHKPDRSDEYERIINCKGRVEPVRDLSDETYGPNRVWLRDENLPGLAMSRSFGDAVAHSVGVIPDPEISVKILDPRDKVMILATDGVWEFMSSQDAVDVVAKHTNAQEAAEALCREAYSRWEAEGEGVADDTTCVVGMINVDATTSEAPHNIEIRRSQPSSKKW